MYQVMLSLKVSVGLSSLNFDFKKEGELEMP